MSVVIPGIFIVEEVILELFGCVTSRNSDLFARVTLRFLASFVPSTSRILEFNVPGTSRISVLIPHMKFQSRHGGSVTCSDDIIGRVETNLRHMFWWIKIFLGARLCSFLVRFIVACLLFLGR